MRRRLPGKQGEAAARGGGAGEVGEGGRRVAEERRAGAADDGVEPGVGERVHLGVRTQERDVAEAGGASARDIDHRRREVRPDDRHPGPRVERLPG